MSDLVCLFDFDHAAWNSVKYWLVIGRESPQASGAGEEAIVLASTSTHCYVQKRNKWRRMASADLVCSPSVHDMNSFCVHHLLPSIYWGLGLTHIILPQVCYCCTYPCEEDDRLNIITAITLYTGMNCGSKFKRRNGDIIYFLPARCWKQTIYTWNGEDVHSDGNLIMSRWVYSSWKTWCNAENSSTSAERGRKELCGEPRLSTMAGVCPWTSYSAI